MTVQAIAGVSPSSEAVVMTEYPSIAAGGIAQLLGSIYESIPSPAGLPKLSYLFALATAPFGILLYALQKLFGQRYVLTNRAIQVWTARTSRMVSSLNLSDFDRVEVVQSAGQVFYNAADLRFVGANGETLLRLKGVKDAGAFRNAIERTAESRRMVQESLATISARG